MRWWSLSLEQVLAIGNFVANSFATNYEREWTSPYSYLAICVRNPTWGCWIVHAYNKLNAPTIPAQTPITWKDVIIDGMSKSTIFSSMYLIRGFYQTHMRELDISYTAVINTSCILWKWLVMSKYRPYRVQQMRDKFFGIGGEIRIELLRRCVRP